MSPDIETNETPSDEIPEAHVVVPTLLDLWSAWVDGFMRHMLAPTAADSEPPRGRSPDDFEQELDDFLRRLQAVQSSVPER
jgi:hypothetical protein